MAAAEDPILTLLKEVAAQKGVTIDGLDRPTGNINVYENDENGERGDKVGGIGYAILMGDVTGRITRSDDRTREVSCIRINAFNVTKTGKGLGSLLLAAALWVGLRNACNYSTLDDMSAKHAELKDNIYSLFGFTYKDRIEVENDKLKPGKTGPDKQLKLPNETQMLKNFKAIFEMTGGKRKTNCTALYKTRKVQAIWKEKSKKVIKKTGTLAHFQWKDFKSGFKKGFMERCKSRKARA